MPGLHIYVDRSDQSIAKNIKIVNDAKQWRSNYISNNGLDNNLIIRINVDALMMDNIIMDKYDGNYQYYINIYRSYIDLCINDNSDRCIFTVFYDGLFVFNECSIFPSPSETKMPYLIVSSSDYNYMSDNIKLYNDALQWRKDYISYKGLSDTGRPISMFVGRLDIDETLMDAYDSYYHYRNYYIDIYNDRIILLNNNSEEILTISSDGSVTLLDIFNKFPYPNINFQSMLGLKIYTDNTVQSKAKYIKLFNDAQQWRDNFIIVDGSLSDIGQGIYMDVNALIIDDTILDKYNHNYQYDMKIYKDHIILLNENDQNSSEVLTIFSDGSVENYITPTTAH